MVRVIFSWRHHFGSVLRTALEQLGAQRMRRHQVMAASTEAAAKDIADDIFAQVKTIAAGLA